MTGGEEVVDPSNQSASMADDHIAAFETEKPDAHDGMDVVDEQVSAPVVDDLSSPAHSGASTAVMSTELNTEIGDPDSGISSPDSPSKASSIVSPIAIVEMSSEPMNEDPIPTGEVENTPEIKVDAMNAVKTCSPESQDAEMSPTVADEISSRTEVVEKVSTTTEVLIPSETDGPEKSTHIDVGANNNAETKEGEMRSLNLELAHPSTEVVVAATSSLEVEQVTVDKGVSESYEPQPSPSMAAELPEEPNRMNTSKQESNGNEDDNVRRGKEDTHGIGITAPFNQIPLDVAPASDAPGPGNGNHPEQMETTSSVHDNGLKEGVDAQVFTTERILSTKETEVQQAAFASACESENKELVEKDQKPPAQEQSEGVGLSGLATLSVTVEEMDERGRELLPRAEDAKEEGPSMHAASSSVDVTMITPASSGLTSVQAKTELEREMELYEASVKEEEARMLAHMRSDQLLAGESTGDSKELLNERKRALESTPNEARKKRGKRVLSTEPLSKDEEDVCFICFDGGELVLCDRRTCPKAYHLTCIGRDTAFFEKKGAWICGWHFCTGCTKPANFQCYTCPTAYCSACLKKADFLCVRQRKGLCEECWPIVHMIENNETTNAEGVEVDFEDQETYECLFKDYWVDLKQRLQLTPAELDKDNRAGGSGGGYMENGESDAEDKGDVEDYNTGSDSGASGEGEDKMETSDDAKKKKRGKAKASLIPPSASPDAVMGTDGEPYILPEEEDVMEDVEEDDVEEYTEEDGDHKSDLQLREGWASKELIEFVKFMDEDPKKPLTKFEVMKLLWAYIKSHKLQDPRKKTQILCDERLQTLFGKKTVVQYEMIKHVQAHYNLKGTKSSRRQNLVSEEVLKMDEDPNEDGVDEKYSKIRDVKDKRRRRKGDDDKFERPSVNEFAAITPKNINLIYLRRQLLEELLDDPEFDSKVCNTFVRIRVPGMVSKSEMCYRLVQVVGTRLQAEHYKAGRKTTNIVLEILNLQKREDVTVDLVSNHEFSEEECQRLRQSIKCGLIKTLTVGDIEDKAKDLQEAKVNDWFETERQRLVNLRDRASEKGRKKELRECVEKLQELNSPAFRAAKLHARPEVTADPRMDPNYESDGNEDKSKDKIMMIDGSATISERSPSVIGIGDKVATASILKSSQLESGSRPDWDSRRKHSSWENSRNRELERGGYESGRSGDKMAYGRVPSYSIEDTNERGYDERDRGWDKEWVMDERDTGGGTGWMGNGRNIRSAPAERWTKEVNNISAGIDAGRVGRSDYRGSTSLTGLNTPVYEGKPDWNKPRELPAAPSMQSTFPLASQLTSTLSKAALEAAEKEKVWHYMDPTGTIQGPFSMEQLRKWNTTGYFPLDLRIWRTNQPRDESVLLTDALAGRAQKERIDPWGGSASVRSVDVVSQATLSVSASASGYNINKSSTDGWRDNGGGSSSSWVDRGSSADVVGRSTASWAVDGGSRVLGRDVISGPAVRDSTSDLKWKAGPAATASWDTYGGGGRSNNSYGSSPTRNSRAEAAARFDPANWGSRSDTVRTSEKDSWTSPSPGGDSYSKPGGGGRSSWGRGSSHSFRESGGSWNSFNEDSGGGGHDNSRPMKGSRGSKKDVPCRFHSKGWCKRGDSCDFWHGG